MFADHLVCTRHCSRCWGTEVTMAGAPPAQWGRTTDSGQMYQPGCERYGRKIKQGRGERDKNVASDWGSGEGLSQEVT